MIPDVDVYSSNYKITSGAKALALIESNAGLKLYHPIALWALGTPACSTQQPCTTHALKTHALKGTN